MRTRILITVMLVLALPALAQMEFNPGAVQTVAAVSTPATTVVTAEVHSYVPSRGLTAQDLEFLATVPNSSDPSSPVYGLRDAVRQLRQAGVCDLPAGGVYIENTSADYWRMYQVWTAPYRVQIPIPEVPRLYIPPLGELPAVESTPALQLDRIEFEPEDVSAPAPSPPAPAPRAATSPTGAVAFGRPGDHQERVIGGVTWVDTPSRQPCEPPEPPDDGTCGPLPPGEKITPPPPPDAAVPGVPGSGPLGPGLGDGVGNTPLTTPTTPDYGSGDATLPVIEPLPPGPGQPAPAQPPSGESPVTPAS